MTSPSKTSGNVPHLPTRIGLTRDERDAADVVNLPIGQAGDSAADAVPLDPAKAIVDAFNTLADLPFVGEKILAAVRGVGATLDGAFGQAVWGNFADVSDLAATGYGSGATLPVFGNPSATMACVLRNITIGASAAGVVKMVAARTAPQQALIANAPQGLRPLGTVRPQANNLTVVFPGSLVLLPGEVLHLIYPTGATVNLDFSCDYRVLAAE